MESQHDFKNTLAQITRIVQAETVQQFIQEQTNESVVALPVGVSVTDLEQYLEQRRRYRGRMRTSLISEYTEFVSSTADQYLLGADCIPCFVNPKVMNATVFFNLGDVDNPGHGDHQACLELEKTEAFNQLLEVNGSKSDQRTLAEWMEDWRDHLEAITEDQTTALPIGAAVASVRRITIGSTAEATSETQTFSNKQSAMAQVEAKNRDQMPAFLKFTCEPYQGLEKRTFTLRLSLITGEKPLIGLRIVRLETEQEEMAKELEEKLRTGFEDTPVKTYVGTFNPNQ